MATIRSVTADWGTLTGDPSAGQKVRYELDRSSFTADLIIDHGHTEDTIEEDGTTATDLWTNLEGLVPSRYTVTFPKGDQYGFHLPVGDDPISLMELLLEQSIPWQPPMLSDIIDAAIEGVYDAFANTTDLLLGDALVGTRADETGATGRTVHAKLAEVLSVKDFGAVGDGITLDGLAAEAAMLAAQASGRPLFWPAGTYNLSDLLTPFVQTAPLVMFGESRQTTILLGTTDRALITSTTNFALCDLTMEGWKSLDVSALVPYEFYTVERVTIRNGSYGIYNSKSASLPFEWAGICDRLTIRDCHIHDLTNNGITWAAPCNQALIVGNRITRTTTRGIQIGRNFASIGASAVSPTMVLAGQDSFKSISIVNNVVEEVRNAPGNNTIHNIIAYGQEIYIAGNVVRECISTAQTKEIGGIYTKARRAVTIGNVVKDLFHGGGGTYAAQLDAPYSQTLGTGGHVTSVVPLTDGTFTSAPIVRFTGGGGSGARAIATLAGVGPPQGITAIEVVTHGTGYNGYPSNQVPVTVDPPTEPGGVQCTAYGIAAGGVLQSIVVTNVGSGYTSPPTATFPVSPDGGIRATASTEFAFGKAIASITLTNSGADYITAPKVTMVGGWGTGGEYYINVKGSPRQATPSSVQGHNTTVIGNHVLCNGYGKYGIRLQNESTIIQGNLVERAALYGILVSSGSADDDPDEAGGEGYDDIQLINNQVNGEPLVGTYGINCTTIGDRVKIAGNLIRDVEVGIAISGGQGTPFDHTIENNQISRVTKQGIQLIHGAPLYNLRVLGNSIRAVKHPASTSQGILVQPSARVHNLEIRANAIRDVNPVGTATGIYVLPSAPLSNAIVDGNTIDCVNVPVPAMILATVVAGVVTALTLSAPGSSYSSVPSVAFTPVDGVGSGATATAEIWPLASITLTHGGSGYTSAPAVGISGGGGSGAAATATVGNGRVTAITLTAPGKDYATAPTIALTGGGGSGAEATATPSSGLARVILGAGGSAYTSAPLVATTGGNAGAGAGSGYGIRVATGGSGAGVIANLQIQLDFITNVKTARVLYTNQPVTWTGEREYSVTNYNPASCATGAAVFGTLAAVGVRPGDIVRVSFVETGAPAVNAAGITFSGDVKVADVIQIQMLNMSGSTKDLAIGTLTARVTRPIA